MCHPFQELLVRRQLRALSQIRLLSGPSRIPSVSKSSRWWAMCKMWTQQNHHSPTITIIWKLKINLNCALPLATCHQIHSQRQTRPWNLHYHLSRNFLRARPRLARSFLHYHWAWAHYKSTSPQPSNPPCQIHFRTSQTRQLRELSGPMCRECN